MCRSVVRGFYKTTALHNRKLNDQGQELVARYCVRYGHRRINSVGANHMKPYRPAQLRGRGEVCTSDQKRVLRHRKEVDLRRHGIKNSQGYLRQGCASRGQLGFEQIFRGCDFVDCLRHREERLYCRRCGENSARRSAGQRSRVGGFGGGHRAVRHKRAHKYPCEEREDFIHLNSYYLL